MLRRWGPRLHTPFPPFSPSLISLMVSVDVKHYVYLLTSRKLQDELWRYEHFSVLHRCRFLYTVRCIYIYAHFHALLRLLFSLYIQKQQLSFRFSFKCCFTSTETTRLIRDGEPRTTTSTFTQLLSSDRVVR